MRKLLFRALVALLVLLVLPGAVSAVEDDATVTITGSIAESIAITVSDTDLDFEDMSTAAPEIAATDVTVTTTSNSWSVTASDEDTSNKGYMETTGLVKLTNPFELSNSDGEPWTWHAMTTDFPSFMSGTTAGVVADTAWVKQEIDLLDAKGTYSITITFTAATS